MSTCASRTEGVSSWSHDGHDDAELGMTAWGWARRRGDGHDSVGMGVIAWRWA